MKKFAFLTLVVLLSSVVMVDLARAEKDPPEPPPIFQTHVVNDGTAPVPVTGVVDIGTFPTPVPVTGTVDIGSLPTLEALKEPFNWHANISALYPVSTYYYQSVSFTVPPGKQLTVETVSMSGRLLANNEVEPFVRCYGAPGGVSEAAASHYLKSWPRTVAVQAGDTGILATEAIKCIVPQDRAVHCGVASTTDDAWFRCNISGYLEDVPSP